MCVGKKRAVICWASERWISRWAIWTRVWQTATSAIQNNSPARTRQPDRPPPVQPVKVNRRSPGAGTKRTSGTFCPHAGRSENCRRAPRGQHHRQRHKPWQSSTRQRSRRRPYLSHRRRPPNRCTRTSTQRRCTRPGHTTGPWPLTTVATTRRISIRPFTTLGYRTWRPPTICSSTGTQWKINFQIFNLFNVVEHKLVVQPITV